MRGLLECSAPEQKMNCKASDVVRAAERVLAGAATVPAKRRAHASSPVVETQSFGFSYGSFQSLSNVSFQARSGEVLALCGPRGCGAKTMLAAIGCTLPGSAEGQAQGDILVAGASVLHDVDALCAQNLAATAFMGGLPEVQSVRNALSRPLRLRGLHDAASLDEVISSALSLMGADDRLEGRMETGVCSLSPVDQRIIALAQALLRNPSALLVEEPTRGLSAPDAQVVADMLKRIATEGAVAVIVECCDAGEVASLADKAAFFLEGTLVEVVDAHAAPVSFADYRTRAYFEGRMR